MPLSPRAAGEADIVLVGLEQEENLGLRSIASFLEMHGLRVEIEPYNYLSKAKLLDKILKFNPKILGFSVLFQGMLLEYREQIRYLRANGVKSHFVIGGHFPTIEPRRVLELIPEIDTVVRHEGEITLLELYNNLETRELWSHIRGIVYRKNGGIEFTPPRPLIEDLDAMPFPKRSQKFETFRDLNICSVQASRGCVFNCSYCSIRQFYSEAPGPKKRTRAPGKVAEEMEALFKQGVRFFKFVDDDFGTKGKFQEEWVRQLAYELEKRGIADHILWRIAVRVDELDLESLRVLKEVGLGFLFLGIEAGCQQSLRVFNKGYTVEDIYRGLEVLHQVGLRFEYGFMMFDPESSFSSIRKNLAFLEQLCKDGRASVHFTKVYPFVGTALAKRLRQEGRLIDDLIQPSYNYLDKKLEFFEAFVLKTFQNAFFGASGLSGKLSMLRFDCEMLRKFYPTEYDIESYDENICNLSKRYNDAALKTLNLALNYIEKSEYGELKSKNEFLNELASEELGNQSRTQSILDSLSPEHKDAKLT